MPYYIIRKLSTRRYRGKPPAPVRGPDDVVQVLGRVFAGQRVEQFVVLLLNARHEVIGRGTGAVRSRSAAAVPKRHARRAPSVTGPGRCSEAARPPPARPPRLLEWGRPGRRITTRKASRGPAGRGRVRNQRLFGFLGPLDGV